MGWNQTDVQGARVFLHDQTVMNLNSDAASLHHGIKLKRFRSSPQCAQRSFWPGRIGLLP
eukprot:2977590-Rhodomonas_salina.1